MKRLISIATVMFFTLFIGSVYAQHGRHGGSYGHSHGSYTRVSHERTSYVSHESYRGGYSHGGYYNRGNYGRAVYGRGGYAGRRIAVPWGAAHRYAYGRPVYFPAYRLYYDPVRCGYTYWNGGRWFFSAALPSFLAGIDLAAADMSYANEIPQPYYAPAPGVGVNIHIGL